MSNPLSKVTYVFDFRGVMFDIRSSSGRISISLSVSTTVSSIGIATIRMENILLPSAQLDIYACVLTVTVILLS